MEALSFLARIREEFWVVKLSLVNPEQVGVSRRAGFREHTPSAKTQNRHPWQAQRGPSLARYVLLQAYAPFALRPADASVTDIDGKITGRMIVAAMMKYKAQGTGPEEESVPRQGRRGPSGHGWPERLSDLTLFPEQARSLRYD